MDQESNVATSILQYKILIVKSVQNRFPFTKKNVDAEIISVFQSAWTKKKKHVKIHHKGFHILMCVQIKTIEMQNNEHEIIKNIEHLSFHQCQTHSNENRKILQIEKEDCENIAKGTTKHRIKTNNNKRK